MRIKYGLSSAFILDQSVSMSRKISLLREEERGGGGPMKMMKNRWLKSLLNRRFHQ